jgi:hypothetical protein
MQANGNAHMPPCVSRQLRNCAEATLWMHYSRCIAAAVTSKGQTLVHVLVVDHSSVAAAAGASAAAAHSS